MKIVFGCDPNATEFKLQLMEYVKGLGHEVADLGSDDPIYANTAIEVAKAVAAKEYDRGIIVCGTGIGVSIAANKVKGAYAACIHDVYQAQRAQLLIMQTLLLWVHRLSESNLQNSLLKNIFLQNGILTADLLQKYRESLTLKMKNNLSDLTCV